MDLLLLERWLTAVSAVTLLVLVVVLAVDRLEGGPARRDARRRYWLWSDADCKGKGGYLSWSLGRYPICVTADGRVIPMTRLPPDRPRCSSPTGWAHREDQGFVPVYCSQWRGLRYVEDAAGNRYPYCAAPGHRAKVERRLGVAAA